MTHKQLFHNRCCHEALQIPLFSEAIALPDPPHGSEYEWYNEWNRGAASRKLMDHYARRRVLGADVRVAVSDKPWLVWGEHWAEYKSLFPNEWYAWRQFITYFPITILGVHFEFISKLCHGRWNPGVSGRHDLWSQINSCFYVSTKWI